MTLKAQRDIHVQELILVTDERGLLGGVVYKWNEKHSVGTRTNHAGPKPSMREVRAAIAAL